MILLFCFGISITGVYGKRDCGLLYCLWNREANFQGLAYGGVPIRRRSASCIHANKGPLSRRSVVPPSNVAWICTHTCGRGKIRKVPPDCFCLCSLSKMLQQVCLDPHAHIIDTTTITTWPCILRSFIIAFLTCILFS